VGQQRTHKYDVVVIGGANTDFIVKGPKLPEPGETIDGQNFLQAFGGKGANQAVACARLGARVAFVGCVGADKRGTETIANFQREGISVRHLRRQRRAATGVALITVDKQGEKQIMTAPGANQCLTVGDIQRAAPLLRSTKVLLMQYEVPEAAVIKAAEIAHKAGALVVIDPAPARPTPKKLLRLIDVIRPNSAEAKVLTGLNIRDRKTACRAAAKLFRAGIKMVALQIGDSGDLILWKGERSPSGLPLLEERAGGRADFPFTHHFLRRLKVKTVDATGAGDAFAAGLAVALAEGCNYREAGILANAVAALSTTKLGVQPALPTRSEVVRFLR